GGLATLGTGASNMVGSSSTTGPSTLRFAGGATTSVFNGQIVDAVNGGSGQVTNLDVTAGTLNLTGANTYTGATTVSAGTLLVGDGVGSGQLGSGTAQVTVNGTGVLAFDLPVINYELTNPIGGSGTLEQRNSIASVGVLHITGVQTWTAGAQLKATSGTIGVASNPGSDTNYALSATAVPAAGVSSKITLDTSATD